MDLVCKVLILKDQVLIMDCGVFGVLAGKYRGPSPSAQDDGGWGGRTWRCRAAGLVDADQVGGGVGVGVADPVLDGEGVGAGVVGGVDADPEPGGALEFGDLRGAVTVEQRGLQVAGVVLLGEGAGLDAPAAGRVGGGVGEGFDADLGDSGAVDADGFGGTDGEVEDAAGAKGPRSVMRT